MRGTTVRSLRNAFITVWGPDFPGIAVVVMTACLLFAPVLSNSAERHLLRIGDPPPAVVLSDLDGRDVMIPDDFRGRVVILHFWASWCPYCLEEMPAFEKLYGKYREKGLAVLAVNVGQDRDTVEAFLGRLGISYPVLLDSDRKAARKYGVVGLPRTYLLDRKGAIKYKVLGEAGEETFNKFVLNLL